MECVVKKEKRKKERKLSMCMILIFSPVVLNHVYQYYINHLLSIIYNIMSVYFLVADLADDTLLISLLQTPAESWGQRTIVIFALWQASNWLETLTGFLWDWEWLTTTHYLLFLNNVHGGLWYKCARLSHFLHRARCLWLLNERWTALLLRISTTLVQLFFLQPPWTWTCTKTMSSPPSPSPARWFKALRR